MLYGLLKAVHLLSLMVWLGGMVYANFFLRPSLALLAPPERVRLMHAVMGRFFSAVSLATLLVLLSGLGMVGLSVQMVSLDQSRTSLDPTMSLAKRSSVSSRSSWALGRSFQTSWKSS